jgi:hypothetical protein
MPFVYLGEVSLGPMVKVQMGEVNVCKLSVYLYLLDVAYKMPVHSLGR